MADVSRSAELERFAAELFSSMTLASPEADPVFDLALSSPAWATGLTALPSLPAPVWMRLWAMFARDTNAAAALVRRQLQDEQVSMVIESRPNTKVVAALLELNYRLNVEQFAALAAMAKPSVAKKLIDLVLDGDVVLDAASKPVALDLARKAGAARWVALVARGAELFDAAERREVFDALRGSDVRSGFWDAQLLLWRHRDLLEHCIDAPRDAWVDVRIAGLPVTLTAAQQARLADLGEIGQRPPVTAAQQLLQRRFVLMALVNSPSCHVELVEHVAEVIETWLHGPDAISQSGELGGFLAELLRSCRYRLGNPHRAQQVVDYAQVASGPQLDWLLGRCVASEFRDRPRPFEALALSYNPNLDGPGAFRLALTLRQHDVAALLGEDLARERYTALVERSYMTAPPWPTSPSSPSSRFAATPASGSHLTPGSFPELGEVTVEQLRSAVQYSYDRYRRTDGGEMVNVCDWFLVELCERAGDDRDAFASALALVSILDRSGATLSELLELVGTV
jgi:hypothetical protein